MIPLSTTMTALWAAIPLADEVPDPADVKPGWLGFGVFLLLAAAVVVLWFSFRKQLRKVNFEEKPSPGESPAPPTRAEAQESEASDESGGARPNGDTEDR